MKAKQLDELREQGVDGLRVKEKELGEQMFRLRLQKAVGQLEDALKLRRTRRDIARIKTLIREKERAAAAAQK